jgi:hypothetical protein
VLRWRSVSRTVFLGRLVLTAYLVIYAFRLYLKRILIQEIFCVVTGHGMARA